MGVLESHPALLGVESDDGQLPPRRDGKVSGQATDLGHVAEKEGVDLVSDGADLVSDGAEAGIVPIPGVGVAATYDELEVEVDDFLLKPVIVDVASLGAHVIGQALEVDGGGEDLLSA